MSRRGRSLSGRHYLNREGCGLDALHLAEAEAERGSITLERECRKVICAFANQYHIHPDEARILLMDTGVRL